jgi:hypothetical protein
MKDESMAPKGTTGAKCEVCGAPVAHHLIDVQELPPVRGHDGRMYAKTRLHSAHWFCEAHKRESVRHPLSELGR